MKSRALAPLDHRAALALAALAALAAALATGCQREQSRVVDRVVVGRTPAMRSLDGAGIRAETLGATAIQLLQRSQGFAAPEKAQKGSRHFLAQVDVDRAEVRAGAQSAPQTMARVAVSVSLEPLGGGGGGAALRETGLGSAQVGPGPDGVRAAMERAVASAVESAVAAFSMQLAAEGKKTPDLVRDLASPDAAVRDHATRVLASRGERDAVPALLSRLRDPDPAVRERAVGALAQLRDPRAVPALIELVHRRDPQYVAEMARIVGDIGGPDANAWLLTMAWGHPEEVVRTAAREALAEMSARELHARAQR